MTDPLGTTARYERDAYGRPASVNNALGAVARFTVSPGFSAGLPRRSMGRSPLRPTASVPFGEVMRTRAGHAVGRADDGQRGSPHGRPARRPR
ncbi:hypothetical protein ACFY1C_12930 [Streptomyces sp. NPDC001279]|uniref:hypothetical protein n=1 Tax=Streptomyces sp. NPDC001279 TaxID=3364556 RepID=UPI0036BF1442